MVLGGDSVKSVRGEEEVLFCSHKMAFLFLRWEATAKVQADRALRARFEEWVGHQGFVNQMTLQMTRMEDYRINCPGLAVGALIKHPCLKSVLRGKIF